VLRGADLLVGLLSTGTSPAPSAATSAAPTRSLSSEPRVEIAGRPECPFSRRALRMLRTLGIAFVEIEPDETGPVPQLFIDGVAIGGYNELAELHSRGELDALRSL
jgi:glutaredoxin